MRVPGRTPSAQVSLHNSARGIKKLPETSSPRQGAARHTLAAMGTGEMRPGPALWNLTQLGVARESTGDNRPEQAVRARRAENIFHGWGGGREFRERASESSSRKLHKAWQVCLHSSFRTSQPPVSPADCKAPWTEACSPSACSPGGQTGRDGREARNKRGQTTKEDLPSHPEEATGGLHARNHMTKCICILSPKGKHHMRTDEEKTERRRNASLCAPTCPHPPRISHRVCHPHAAEIHTLVPPSHNNGGVFQAPLKQKLIKERGLSLSLNASASVNAPRQVLAFLKERAMPSKISYTEMKILKPFFLSETIKSYNNTKKKFQGE